MSARSPIASCSAFAAWTLAGLFYAGVSALAPVLVADIAGTAAVAAALAVTLGYALWSYAACRGAGDAAAGR